MPELRTLVFAPFRALAAWCRRDDTRRLVRQFLRRRSAVVGLVLVLGLLVCGLAAHWLAPHGPDERFVSEQAPSLAHWFGTDELGRA